MEKKVTILIVTWNSLRYIRECLKSIEKQTFEDFSVTVIDNNSTDKTVDCIRNEFPNVTILKNFNNQGFCRAYNQGITLSKSEFVLVMNHDVILSPDFLKNLISFAEEHPNGASFGGKLLKLKSIQSEIDELESKSVASDIIDEAGLVMFKSRKFINRGEGEKDAGQYEKTQEVFGLSGACVLYRKSALEETAVHNEFFDNDFFAYKEDIDLAWRLRIYGWENWYVHTAIGYHHRRLASLMQPSMSRKIKSRHSVPKKLRIISLRNHHLLLVKNEFWSNFFRHLPRIIFRECILIGYILIFEQFQFKAFGDFFKLIPASIQKRRVIMAHKKVLPSDIRKWIS